MVNEVGLFETPDKMPLDFSLWGCMKSEVCKWNLPTGGELLARILDAAVRIKRYGDQLRQTTLNVLTEVAKCIQDDVGVSQNLLQILTYLSFLCNKFFF